jgi:hypothetical protein
MASEKTKLCPKCGYEYEPWVEQCPDCGEQLQAAEPRLRVIKGELDPDKDPRWTQVTNVPNAIIGNFLKSQLEDAGIPVIMRRSNSVDIAEFSHNDFVPQDILVPLHQVREARRLIDSPPGDEYGPHFPDEYDSQGEDGSTSDEPDSSQENNLPPGWAMLPTEADLSARQQVRRSHGEAVKGWYWSDERPLYEEKQSTAEYAREEPEQEYFDDRYEYDAPGGYNSGPSRWIRLMYAILLLVLSLPFILQILGQIWAILGNPW